MATDTPPLALRTDAEGRTCVDVVFPQSSTPYTYRLTDDGHVTYQRPMDGATGPMIHANAARAIAMLVNARDGAVDARECDTPPDAPTRCARCKRVIDFKGGETGFGTGDVGDKAVRCRACEDWHRLASDVAHVRRVIDHALPAASTLGAPPVRCTSCRRWVDEMEVTHGIGESLLCDACGRLDEQHMRIEELSERVVAMKNHSGRSDRDALARVREQVQAKLRRENSLPARVALANVLDIIDAEANRG